jgi:hypothetical protein
MLTALTILHLGLAAGLTLCVLATVAGAFWRAGNAGN